MSTDAPARHVVIDARASTSRFPGIGRYLVNLIRALPPHLDAAEQLSVLHPPSLSVPPSVRAYETAPAVFSLSQQWHIPRLLRHIRATLFHSPYVVTAYFPPTPLVLNVNDLIPLLYPAMVSRRARYSFPPLLRLALRRAAHVIAISEATKRDLTRHFDVSEADVTVIPLAPDPMFSPPSAPSVDAARRRLGLPEQYVLYLGSNKPHKNLRRLVEAWSLVTDRPDLTDWTLVIAGVWDPRHPDVRIRATELALTERVTFLGPVEETDLPALYGGADVFVFPSLYEGFGLPVIEAMACGVPVACSHTSSLPEVGGDAACYFDPEDVEDVAETLAGLLRDPARRSELSLQGRRRAARFSWSSTARQTLNVYRRVAKLV